MDLSICTHLGIRQVIASVCVVVKLCLRDKVAERIVSNILYGLCVCLCVCADDMVFLTSKPNLTFD